MKVVLSFFLVIAIMASSVAQLSKYSRKYEKRMPIQSTGNSVISPVLQVNPSVGSKSALEDQLGTTLFDLQTNASSQNRFYVYPDGTMAATWTMGFNDPSFGDRGTGYNYFDGNSWGSAPSARIESTRTGWPSYCPWNGNGELVISSGSTTSLVMNTRSVKGTGTWTQTTGPEAPAGAPALICPRAITSGTNHQNIHVLCLTMPASSPPGFVYLGLDGALLYWRSTDGGNSWDLSGIQIPGLTSDNYDGFSPDEYSWGTPHGDTIYFCVGGPHTDNFIMKSTDNGISWVKIQILENSYKKLGQVAYHSPWMSTDGSVACEMDLHSGIIHFAAGIGAGSVGYNGSDSARISWANYNGLLYWNTTMDPIPEADSLSLDSLNFRNQLAGYYADGGWLGDTLIFVPSYGTGLTSHPCFNIDNHGNVLLLWDGITYQNPEPSTNNNYRHIWIREWCSSANAWEFDQMDLNTGNYYIYSEYVYPWLARNTNSQYLDYIYQTASSPGTAVGSATSGNPLPYKTCTMEHRQLYLDYIPDCTVGINEMEQKSNYVGQNFPNPSNGITKLNIYVDTGSYVYLEVVDILGGKILESDMGFVVEGAHQLDIDASQLNTGIYFYTVRINGQSFIHKMVVD